MRDFASHFVWVDRWNAYSHTISKFGCALVQSSCRTEAVLVHRFHGSAIQPHNSLIRSSKAFLLSERSNSALAEEKRLAIFLAGVVLHKHGTSYWTIWELASVWNERNLRQEIRSIVCQRHVIARSSIVSSRSRSHRISRHRAAIVRNAQLRDASGLSLGTPMDGLDRFARRPHAFQNGHFLFQSQRLHNRKNLRNRQEANQLRNSTISCWSIPTFVNLHLIWD
jgi:hypothetical protein